MEACDLMIDENSCRFCLSNAQTGSRINDSTFFHVDGRLVRSTEILSYLNVNLHHDSSYPNLPQKLCNDCKKSIITFYTLKKNFHENEAILLDKLEEGKGGSSQQDLIPLVNEFMKEHSNENIQVTKYTDKLIIKSLSKNDEDDEDNLGKLSVVFYDRPSREIVCIKCEESFDCRSQFKIHSNLCSGDENKSVVDPDQSDLSNDSNFTEQPSSLAEIVPVEEYLEDETALMSNESLIQQDESTNDSLPVEVVEEAATPQESSKLSFSCKYCEKPYTSRSGRDTHEQLTHRVPKDFSCANIDEHEIEQELETGELSKLWKCSDCGWISKKKDHHLTHLKRHAIRENEIKLETEQETCFVIMKNQSAGADDEQDSAEIAQQIIAYETAPEKRSLKRRATSIEDASQILKLTMPKGKHKVIRTTDGSFFSCPECFSKFRDEESANSHIQRFANNGLCTTALCDECSVVFPSLKLFKRHQESHALNTIVEHFEDYKNLVCLSCLVAFVNQSDFNVHMALHVVNTNYQHNPQLSTKIDGCELLVQDLDLKWNGEDHRCGYCSKTGDKMSIYLHLTLFHASLTCPFDKQEFNRSLGYFVNHMKVKHPELFSNVELTFTCPHCEEQFRTKLEMTQHSKFCEAKLFPCPHCEKKFALERQLKQHLITVTGTKNHKCSECDKAFANRTELNVHMRSHTKSKPYVCTFPGCEKTFRTNSHRSSHMDTHSSNENYQCKFCDKKFRTRGSRRIHEKTHSDIESICQLCQKQFGQRSHLIRHVNSVHHIECNSYNLNELVSKHKKITEAKQSDDSS